MKEAKERAEDSNRIKGDFLATISHEIRTPMNGIIGMLQILRDSKLDAEQISQVDIATGSADTLLRLLNDILDFSKVESGKLEFECIPFEPAVAMREVVALLQPRAVEKKLSLNLILPPGPNIRVDGDPARLKQVLLNLTGNAVKFTPSGSVEVRALWAREAMEVSIIDTGTGIPADRLEAIFLPFEQVGEAAQRATGTGLGLAIAHELVRKMGGSLAVESTVGVGSTFTLLLPLRYEDREDWAGELESQSIVEVDTEPPLLELPPPAELESLRDLAAVGDIPAIARRAEELALDPRITPFARRLLAVARDFDDAGIDLLLALEPSPKPEGPEPA